MRTNSRVILDSISPAGVRLTTLEVTFPRMVLAEFNTHRVFSRNSASSRAIPVEKQIARIEEDPYVPTYWGKNQRGMQAEEELDPLTQMAAVEAWLDARADAVHWAQKLLDMGVHKQLTNRLLEPFMWHTVLVTATEWDNFFALRRNKDAQPEIQDAANAMYDALNESEPTEVPYGMWHLPLIREEDLEEVKSANWANWNSHIQRNNFLIKISIARCARVSYLTHDGRRDLDADITLYDRLYSSGHMSPFEHVATPLHWGEKFSGNFRGWEQYRKRMPNENNFGARK